MAVLNREEYFESLTKIIGDRNDDDTIAFMENMSDTYNDLENRVNGDGIDWKQKYEENDKKWKETYKNRFFNGNAGSANYQKPNGDETEEEKKPITVDDLFEPVK